MKGQDFKTGLNPYSAGSETVGLFRQKQMSLNCGPVLILILLEVRLLDINYFVKRKNYACLNPYSAGSETVGRQRIRLDADWKTVLILILLEVRLLDLICEKNDKRAFCLNPYSAGSETVGHPATEASNAIRRS